MRRSWWLLASSCIIGPITAPGNLVLASGFDPAQVGYARSEFFLAMSANSYSSPIPLTNDGVWNVEPDPVQALYTTRLVVHRPIDPDAFNGTVIVEWLNVTAGADLANDWVMGHNELIREGYAWIGVSAGCPPSNSAWSTRRTRTS